MQTTEVVAALIRQGDRFLICKRPAEKARGLLWEFPGGKVEPGETQTQALIRECREELAVSIETGALFMDVTHSYADLTIHLSLYEALIRQGTPELLEHTDLKWIRADEIEDYTFCPADVAFLEKLENT